MTKQSWLAPAPETSTTALALEPEQRFGSTLPAGITRGKIFFMKVTKATSRGQVTIPVEIRTALGIDEDSYLEVSQVGDEVRLRKLVSVRPLGEEDPIWQLVGASGSGVSDAAEQHDRYLANAAMKPWRGSS